MSGRATGLFVVAALSTGCRSDAPAPAPDADAEAPAPARLEVEALGVRVELPTTWTVEVRDPDPAVSQPGSEGPKVRARSRDPEVRRRSEVRTWGEARRARGANGDPFLVPARVVLTSEPAPEGPPEEVFSSILSDLERIGERRGVTLERSGFASRKLAGLDTARLRVRYRVGDAPGTRVRHESVVVLRARTADRERTVVTITATFAEADAGAVEAEVEQALERMELRPPLEEAPPRAGGHP